jgi:hypothetical protein
MLRDDVVVSQAGHLSGLAVRMKRKRRKLSRRKRVVCIFVDKFASRPERFSGRTYPLSESIKRGY